MVSIVKDQRAAATFFGVIAPGQGGLGHIPLGGARGRIALDTDGQRIADLAGLNQSLGALHRRVEDEILEYAEDDTG